MEEKEVLLRHEKFMKFFDPYTGEEINENYENIEAIIDCLRKNELLNKTEES